MVLSSNTLLSASGSELGEPLAGAFEQLRSDSEVYGCRRRADMAKEGRKVEEASHGINASSVPAQERGHSKRMTEAVQMGRCDTRRDG